MPCPTPIPQAELIVLLNEARTAYHKLMTGTSLVELRDQNGETVRFTSINRQALYSYIQDLERQLCAPTSSRPNRPMGFIF